MIHSVITESGAVYIIESDGEPRANTWHICRGDHYLFRPSKALAHGIEMLICGHYPFEGAASNPMYCPANWIEAT